MPTLNKAFGNGIKNTTEVKIATKFSPHLLKKLEILQKPTTELRQTIFQELVVNPALEIDFSTKTSKDIIDKNKGNEQFSNGTNDNLKDEEENNWEEQSQDFSEKLSPELKNINKKTEKLLEFDSNQKNNHQKKTTWLNEINQPIPKKENTHFNKQYFSIEDFSIPTTLHDFLYKQLAYVDEEKIIIEIVKTIIANIDERGYLRASQEEIQQGKPELKWNKKNYKKALQIVQNFEPAGIGASNLKECLLLQLKFLRRKNTNEWMIVNNHLTDLAKKKYKKIAKELKITEKQAKTASQIISSLNPRPGNEFQNVQPNQFIIPDIKITILGKKIYIKLNDKNIPRLRISTTFKNLLIEHANDNQLKKYVKEKIIKGKDFINLIRNRNQTLLLISQEICKKQKKFIFEGIKQLKPMKMKEIAQQLNMHESTISRSITGKYIQAPHGIFSLKSLFTQSTKNNGNISNLHVKKIISNFIKKENQEKPLTDSQISNKLERNSGIKIARRTVTKYRNQLGILSADLRKS